MPDLPCLITGGAGNLACQLTFDLVAGGYLPVLMDVAERPAAAIAPGCAYIRADLTDTAAVTALLQAHRPRVILHFASLLSGKSEQDRPLAWRVNMDGTFALFDAALRAGVAKVFFPSSVASYGGTLPDPLPEDFPQWPGGLYGVTKVAAERLGVYYHQYHGLDFRCLRLPIVISAYAPPGAASAYASHAFVQAARGERFVFKVRPQTRAATVYVKDVLRAILLLLEAPAQKLTRRVYNIHGLAPTAGELAEAIRARIPKAVLAFEPDPKVVALIEGWPRQIDDHAARADWNWQPRYDLPALADDFLAGLRQPVAQ